MSDFSEALSGIIKNNSISVYGLAKKIQCERTGFQKMMTGERKMDLRTFSALKKELTDKINPPELEDLYEKFAQEYYGAADYQRIRYIKKRLEDSRKLELYIQKAEESGFLIEDYLNAYDQEVLGMPLGDTVGEKEKEVIRQIDAVLQKEFDMAEETGQIPRLYVNLPSVWKYITNLLLILLNVREIKGNIDLKMIFGKVDVSGQGGGKESGKWYSPDCVQIEDFITASEFAAYGYNTFEMTATPPGGVTGEVLFPYYLITDHTYLMLSYDGSLLIESNHEGKIKQIAQKYREMVKGRTEFLKVVNPDIYSSVILARDFNHQGNVFEVVNRLCVAAFYTKDILRKIVPQDYPDRNFAIETVGMFYGSLLNQTISMYFTIESVRHFMESDDTKMEGQYFFLQFTPEIKLEILHHLYDYFYRSQTSTIHMLKKPIMSNQLHIFGWDSKIVCACQYVYRGDQPVDAMSFVYNPVVTGHFERFNEYTIHSEVCLDKESSLKVLDNLIRSYDQ